MPEIVEKEVYFGEYCQMCKYEKLSEQDDPCYDCLHESVRANSHKPVNWEEKEK